MCITVSKGSLGDLESQELCFLGYLGSVLILNHLALFSQKAGQRLV